MKRPSKDQALSWTSFIAPLGASLAANITWGVRTGSSVLVIAGVLAPVLLVLSIERLRRLPPTTSKVAKLVRGVAIGGAITAVAGWSWLHTSLLLISELPAEPNQLVHGLSLALCIAAFLPVDGLAVLSVLALDAEHDRREAEAAGPESAQADEAQAEAATDGPAVPEQAEAPRSDEELVARLEQAPQARTRNAVKALLGVGSARADRLLEQLARAEPGGPGGPPGHDGVTEPADVVDREVTAGSGARA